MTIPKIIHQIWIQGYDALPDDLKEKNMLIKKHNPYYRVIVWDETKILELLEYYPEVQKLYQDIPRLKGIIKVMQSKSDVARLIILKHYGGFYMDIDYSCPLSLDTIHDNTDQLIVVDSEYQFYKYIPVKYHPKYGASFWGIIPNHPALVDLLQELVKQDNRDNIGTLFDRYLQQHYYPIRIIDPKKVSSHTSCHQCSICYTPKKSNIFFGRELLVNIGCYGHNTYLVISLILIIIIILILCFRKKF